MELRLHSTFINLGLILLWILRSNALAVRDRPSHTIDFIKKAKTSLLSFSICATFSVPVFAADIGGMTERQHLVAEAWKATDKMFVDRTFK